MPANASVMHALCLTDSDPGTLGWPTVVKFSPPQAHCELMPSPGNIPKALSAAATVWNKFIPDEPFSYTFLDDSFNTLYKADIKTSQLILIFAVLGIIISALGLFGLAAFDL